MDWLLLPLVFVIWCGFALGAAIAGPVLDEVRPNRTRFAFARDTASVLLIAIGAYAIAGGFIALIAGIASALLIAFASKRAHYTITSALGIGLAFASGTRTLLASAAIIAIIANVLVGALRKERKETLFPTITQPVGTILVAVLVVLLS